MSLEDIFNPNGPYHDENLLMPCETHGGGCIYVFSGMCLTDAKATGRWWAEGMGALNEDMAQVGQHQDNESKTDYLSTMNKDVSLHLMKFLDPKQAKAVALTCRSWANLIRQKYHWPRLEVRLFQAEDFDSFDHFVTTRYIGMATSLTVCADEKMTSKMLPMWTFADSRPQKLQFPAVNDLKLFVSNCVAGVVPLNRRLVRSVMSSCQGITHLTICLLKKGIELGDFVVPVGGPKNWPLESVTINLNGSKANTGLLNLLTAPTLHTLKIRKTAIPDSNALSKLLRSVKTLELIRIPEVGSCHMQLIAVAVGSASRLEWLTITISKKDYLPFAFSPTLKRLDLVFMFPTVPFYQVGFSYPHIERVGVIIADMDVVKDFHGVLDICSIQLLFPNITHLEVAQYFNDAIGEVQPWCLSDLDLGRLIYLLRGITKLTLTSKSGIYQNFAFIRHFPAIREVLCNGFRPFDEVLERLAKLNITVTYKDECNHELEKELHYPCFKRPSQFCQCWSSDVN